MADLVRYTGRALSTERAGTPPLLAGYEPAAEEFDLRQGFAILRRRAGLILLISAFALAATAYLVFQQVPQYRATAVIRLADQRGAMTSGLEAAGKEVLGNSDDPLLSQIEVLRTRSVARSVVDRLGLQLRPVDERANAVKIERADISSPDARDTLQLRFSQTGFSASRGLQSAQASYGQMVTLSGLSFTVPSQPDISDAAFQLQPREIAVDSLLRNLRARAREKTDVVDVEFNSPSPLLAQRVVNTVVEEFQAFNARRAQDESRRRRTFLEAQLREMDSLQAVAQSQLSEFRRREQVFSSREKFATEQAGLSGLEVRRQELLAERRMFTSLLNELSRPRRSDDAPGLLVFASSPEVSSNPVVTALFSQLLSYEAARDSLTMGDYGRAASDPDVQRLGGLIASTRTKLGDALSGHVGALNARIAALDGLRGRSSAEMQALPYAEAEEVRYVQNVEAVQRMADQLRGEYQKARITEAVEGGQVEILDFAALPQKPIPARRTLKLALGLMLGLLLASGLAFGLEQMNTAIRGPDELEGALAIPGLAVIPRMMSGAASSSRLHLPSRATARVNGSAKPLVTVSDASSTGAEAYRKLRTNLIFAQALQQLRRLLVTSASAGEGKSTVAANLGVTFAQQGMRVLLVDADLRRPTLHRVFAVPQAPGLTQAALGQEPLDAAIRPTRIHNLFVLPAGTLPANPAELLGQEQTRALFAQLSADFDLVIVDSSPVAVAADAVIAATLVDGVLMVVRAGETDRQAAQYAIQQIANVGGKVVGAVLNDPDAKLPRYGQRYSYHYEAYKARGA
ncbi:MAG TPA: polysaccharide biosynthesis tyrosine autokinase [Longimicrobiales bacterium]